MALGGNALDERSSDAVHGTAEQLAAIVLDGHELVITHGNGPQVGELLLDQEARGRDRPDRLPLDVLGAMTQAQLGYVLQREIEDVLVSHDDHTDVVTVITEIVVDADDPQFADPTKPIGPRYDTRPDDGAAYVQVEDGRWRRVVPSPQPQHLVERAALRAIVEDGIVPICAGGGGVPVVRQGGALAGVEAVIDKDLASALVARDLDAEALVILTDVAGVELQHGTPRARRLDELTTGDARLLLEQLPAGSMRPKVRAATEAAEAGMRAVIGRLSDALATVTGDAGTRVVVGEPTGLIDEVSR